jgi:hypothetical protein
VQPNRPAIFDLDDEGRAQDEEPYNQNNEDDGTVTAILASKVEPTGLAPRAHREEAAEETATPATRATTG